MEIKEKRTEQADLTTGSLSMKNATFLRSCGLWLILGGVMTLVLGTTDPLFPTQSHSLGFTVRQLLVAVSHALVLIGLIGLARSDAAGKSPLAKIGLGILLLGGALFIPSELILIANDPLGSSLDGICAILMAVGFTLAGIAVLLTRHWQSWHRFTPLLCGLYIFLVLIPIIAITDGPALFLALGGWGVPLLLIGVSLRAEARGQQDGRPVSAQENNA
jgi:hypothetical protein